MEQSRCATGIERIEYEDLVLRPSVVTAPKARPHREPAEHRRSKPAPNHPWREGHEERRKQLLLDRTQMSALIWGLRLRFALNAPLKTAAQGCAPAEAPMTTTKQKKGTLLMR